MLDFDPNTSSFTAYDAFIHDTISFDRSSCELKLRTATYTMFDYKVEYDYVDKFYRTIYFLLG